MQIAEHVGSDEAADVAARVDERDRVGGERLRLAHVHVEPFVARALAACTAAEAAIARRQAGWRGATNFCLNPKSGGAHLVVKAAAAMFPSARHLYM